MSLLDGGIAGMLGGVFSAIYLDGTLHRRTAPTYDAGGAITGAAWTDLPVKAQLDSVTESMRQAPGYTDKDQAIFVLAIILSGTITTDDEITVKGQRWAIAGVTVDPGGAYFQLRGQRA